MTADSTLVVDEGKNQKELYNHEKLFNYVQSLTFDLNLSFINVGDILKKIESGLSETLTVKELVTLTCEAIDSLTTVHYDHSLLAGRCYAKYLKKKIPNKFSESVKQIRSIEFPKFNKSSKNLINDNFYKIVLNNSDLIDNSINSKKDYTFSYFALKTLEKSYFLKNSENESLETPQFLLMRVAIGIHYDNIKDAIETYSLMSDKFFIHASPTLFNAGTEFEYLSSCFLLAMSDDSIDGIYDTLHKAALISKSSGGLGINIHNIRSSGTYISGTNGTSNGIIPMLKVFNATAKYVDQGGNKRPGAFAIYLEPWHGDILNFLNLRKNHGNEEERARDLFYALWIPDLFMEKVEKNEDWCLFSEDQCPGLSDTYGEEFNKLYHKYESEERYLSKISAQKLWHAIITAQIETGNPFLLYKDSCNFKSNQKNLGTIKSSNLCCEIVEYSSEDEVAVCNLASIALPSFVEISKLESSDKGKLIFNFAKLHQVAQVVCKNLNRVIDVGSYPVKEAEYSNFKNRPIAIGVQGLSDTFLKLKYAFDSEEAKELNKQIFETIYHGALTMSVKLSEKYGCYESFEGSPASQGLLQFDLWNYKVNNDMYDWDELKKNIAKHGLRNSLVTALMPTASTSQILGFTESFEPITSNIYTRRVLSGEFQVVNKYLIDDLIELGVWSNELKDDIIRNNGSIQDIEVIPKDIKRLYRTVWELSQRSLIDLSCDRSPFVDQSQSLNLYLKNPTMSKITSMHFYAWKKGLKTGIYYLRTQAASEAIKFTLDPINTKKRVLSDSLANENDVSANSGELVVQQKKIKIEDTKIDIHDNEVILACNINDPEHCESCSA